MHLKGDLLVDLTCLDCFLMVDVVSHAETYLSVGHRTLACVPLPLNIFFSQVKDTGLRAVVLGIFSIRQRNCLACC